MTQRLFLQSRVFNGFLLLNIKNTPCLIKSHCKCIVQNYIKTNRTRNLFPSKNGQNIKGRCQNLDVTFQIALLFLTFFLQMIPFSSFFHSQKSISCQRLKRDVNTLSPKHSKELLTMKYFSCAELYNMAPVIPLAVTMCAKYNITSLTEATLQIPFSKTTLVKISTERAKITETLAKERIEKGNNLVIKLVNHR